ncbi:hypothetical protein GCM10020331_081790 [Ectobacillus funiculus]
MLSNSSVTPKEAAYLQIRGCTALFIFLEKQDVHLLPLLFGETQDDQELLTTVRTYLECNLNVSFAAKKKQYMHRNSVQYRVDKFIERTGIDIKTFKGAVAVYMALLMQDSPLLSL